MPVFATNRKARFDYDIKDTLEAGVVLTGAETKSVRDGKVRLTGSYAVIRGGEAYLLNTDISAYQPQNLVEKTESARTRKLLLNRREIELLAKAIDDKLSIVPLSFYSKGRVLKLELGIGRSRHDYDKREAIKKKDIGREVGRRIK
ncbi:MAG: SsrA-binding protein SmpB [Candidatus Colwellbacteria bacterium]|nr:SsrA-binding protein SmpB [Candidatus Colwellbacteria bacterium]